MKELFKIAFTYSGIEGLQKGIYFLIIPILTYYISALQYGLIAVVLMIISFLQIIYIFSLDSVIMRYYIKIKKIQLKQEFLGTVFLSAIGFIIIWTLFFICFGKEIFFYIFPNIEFFPYIFIALLIVGFKVINLFYISFLKATQNIKEYIIFYNIYFFFQTLLILLFILHKNGDKALLYLYALFISQVISFVYVIFKIRNIIKFRINKKLLKFSLRYSITFIPIKFFNIINSSIDRYILMIYFNIKLVGYYYLGVQIATIVQMLLLALNSAYVPKFYNIYEKGKVLKKYDEIYQMSNLIIFIVLFIEIILLNLYDIIFHFINQEYYNAKEVIPFLILYYTLFSVYYINTNALSISYKLNLKKIYGIIIGIFFNIIFSLLLINVYQVIGVAIGTIIGNIVTILYFIFLVRKYTDFKFKNFIYLLVILIVFLVNYVNYFGAIKYLLDIVILYIYYIFLLKRSKNGKSKKSKYLFYYRFDS